MKYKKISALLLTALLAVGTTMAQTSTGPKVHGNVYGGGNAADVGGDATVNMSGGQVGVNTVDNDHGNVFGGGKGQVTTVVGKVEVNIGKKVVVENSETTTTYSDKGTVKGSVYGGSALGAVNGTKATDWDKDNLDRINVTSGKTTEVNIFAGTINGNVYGGGRGQTGDDAIAAKSFGVVTVKVGPLADKGTLQVDGSVYGGSDANGVLESNVTVDVIRGTLGKTESEVTTGGNVHGGGFGQPTLVKGSVEVNIGERTGTSPNYAYSGYATIKGDVYGGSAMGNVNTADRTSATTGAVTNVNLYGCTSVRDIFGGGLGDNTSGSEVAANVYGPVTVTVEGGTARNVFGCNNTYGAPQGTVEVHINGTAEAGVGNVYGGGNEAAYTGTPIVSMTGGTVGNVFGGGLGSTAIITGNTSVTLSGGTVTTNVYGGGSQADMTGDVAVNIEGGTVNHDVYGGGAKAHTNTGNLNSSSEITNAYYEVPVTAGTTIVTGLYTKSGEEYNKVTTLNAKAAESTTYYRYGTNHTTTVNLTGGTVKGDAYGGGLGEAGTPGTPAYVYGDVNVILNGTQMVTGHTTGDNPVLNAGRVFGCNNVKGTPKGHVKVWVQKTAEVTTPAQTIDVAAVFGGGNQAPYEPQITTEKTEVEINRLATTDRLIVDNVYGGGNEAGIEAGTEVKVISGEVKTAVFGGCNTSGTVAKNVLVSVTGGTVGTGSTTVDDGVFGGGYGSGTGVTGNVVVNIGNYDANATTDKITGNADIKGDVYGGSAKGNVNKQEEAAIKTTSTTVNLYAGTVEGDVYGGGLGVKAVAADPEHNIAAVTGVVAHVYGNVRVDLNNQNGTCIVQGRIFGCNNANGAPEGTSEVHIYKTIGWTDNKGTAETSDDVSHVRTADVENTVEANRTYELAAVFGGGNEASGNNATKVVIETCDPSIEYVYGGGNAADVGSTDVTVLGAYEIGTLFGGGNGEDENKPAANVNGVAKTTLRGGTIHVVYGGSNKHGDITGGAQMDISDTNGTCPLSVGQIYGAGNEAEMQGGTSIIMGCQKDGVIDEIYAGARNADVSGGVKLTITSGRFGRVFGGNKDGGKLKGSITLNIEENNKEGEGNCGTPIIIGELYGGGNLADYSVYGYDDSGNPKTAEDLRTEIRNREGNSTKTDAEIEQILESEKYNDPEVNIHSFTSIGAVYGGGFRAQMVANPIVNINVAKGSHYNDPTITAGTFTGIPISKKNTNGTIVSDGTVDLTYPAHTQGAIGAIGNVFGGGNEATLTGNATVNIGTETTIDFITKPSFTGAPTYTTIDEGLATERYRVPVEGVNITGNVYGGGNLADIIGNTQVNICAKYNVTNDVYDAVAENTDKVTISGDVFGAGKGADDNVNAALVSGNSAIVMKGGSVKKSVYGGGELSQVGHDTEITVAGGTIGTPNEGSNVYGGATYGNIYGGGKGNKTNHDAGLIKGNTKITVQNTIVDANTTLTPTILHNIYGGGAYGSVGTITRAAAGATYVPGKTNAVLNMPTSWAENTGKAEIYVKGGEIGSNGNENGMVFGSSRGDVDTPVAPSEGAEAVDPNDRMAWVKETIVEIGTSGAATGPTVNGSVYGSGENGHVFSDTQVRVYSGKIGIDGTGTITDPVTNIEYTGADYPKRGNVYGGGCGEDNYPETSNFNPLAGIVLGDTYVTIDGGKVVHNVYGAGALGSVGSGTLGGKTIIAISNGQVGDDGVGDGNVYGAARGKVGLTQENIAQVRETSVTISSNGNVKGSVYGGGDAGNVRENAAVSMTGGAVNGNVYGGGLGDASFAEAGRVLGNTTTTIGGGTTHGSVYGGGAYGIVKCAVSVNVTDGEVKENVYGGGALANTNTDNWNGTSLVPTYHEVTGLTAGTSVVTGLYTESSGIFTEVTAADTKAASGATYYRLTDTKVRLTGGEVSGSVYGGGLGENTTTSQVAANVYGPVTVTVTGGKAGNVYGCNDTYGAPQSTVAVNVEGTNAGTGSAPYAITNVFGGGNQANYTYTDGPIVSVSGDSYVENVYGGGNEATVNASNVTISTTNDEGTTTKSKINKVFGGGNNAGVTSDAIVSMTSGKVLSAMYGGCNANGNIGGNVNITVTGGIVGDGTSSTDVLFGGGYGQPTTVTGNVEVNVGSLTVTSGTASFAGNAIINGNIYGGGEQGSVNTENGTNTTTVNLFQGTVNGAAYGGGLGTSGTSGVPAYVYGDAFVNLNGITVKDGTNETVYKVSDVADARGCVVNQLFGANNVKGTPKGHVTVHVYGTQNINLTKISDTYEQNGSENLVTYLNRLITAVDGTYGAETDQAKALAEAKSAVSGLTAETTLTDAQKNAIESAADKLKNAFDKLYDVHSVFGGGNLADYEPTKATSSTPSVKEEAYSEVIIEGCDYTSIKNVYGGGNAAAVPATNVHVKSAKVIDYVFGGGNGEETSKPGANVGYKTVDRTATPGDSEKYGTGNAVVKLGGGFINNVFGGSNTLGYVAGSASSEIDQNATGCDLKIGNLYGAGRKAKVDNSVNIKVGCIPYPVKNVYGGSQEADIDGDVTLTILGGSFDNVFGGNDAGGKIKGKITVNIEEREDGCYPIIIGNLYGGGNEAPYPGTEDNTDRSVTVNAKSFTRIGNIYGGGKGEDAIVTGKTEVNVDQVKGYGATTYPGTTYGTGENAVTIPTGIGSIGNVYGGGDAADVIGSTEVNIGTKPTVTINDVSTDVLGVNITGSVYGGGNAADVVGTTTINIGTQSYTVEGAEGTKIGTDVYGGGFGETTTVTGDVNVNIGGTSGTGDTQTYFGYAVITGNVYGGSAKGKVNATKSGTGTEITYTASAGTTKVNLYGGTVNHIYGGGYGLDNASAHVYGAVTVDVYGGTATSVYGANNLSGAPQSTVAVTINKTAAGTTEKPYAITNVYGGGNHAAYTGTPVVIVTGNSFVEKVFGGGDAASVGGSNVTISTTANTETVTNSNINNVYGGGNNAGTEGDALVSMTSGNVLTALYGGCNATGTITGTATVTVTGGTVGTSTATNPGVFGGGYGHGTTTNSAIVNVGDATTTTGDTPTTTYSGTATINGDVYGGSALGAVGTAVTNLYSGTLTGHVFGGGMGSGSTDATAATVTTSATVNQHNIAMADGKNIYGGCNVNGTAAATTVNIYDGSVNHVFGGGFGANTFVTGNVLVNIGGTTGDGATINGDVYGGSAQGHVNGSKNTSTDEGVLPIVPTDGATTTVNLNKGIIFGDAYGGGLGLKAGFDGHTGADVPAYVGGNVFVNVDGAAFKISYYEDEGYTDVVKSGRVFGSNNLCGMPLGDVKVTVNKTTGVTTTAGVTTVNPTKPTKGSGYELAAVYGGGNLASFTTTGKKASVVVNSCENTSVQYVYGGGNAAAVPRTDVQINGAYEIGYVFGGGNGKDKYKNEAGWQINNGANVNGTAATVLKGGKIHEAYGGSNEKGTITGSVSINTGTGGDCKLEADKIYGAGRNADIEGDLIVVLGCKEARTEEVYGGAENANVKGNVEMTITSGEFGKVFGGNNQSGSIFGHIILNIEESGCTPIKIDELYGCGYDAAYSVYGYYHAKDPDTGEFLYIDVEKTKPVYMPRTSADDSNPIETFANYPHTVPNATTKQYDDPELNIISATYIGKVFGGGLGSGAKVYGNPTVNINQTNPYEFDATTGEYKVKTATALGTIGDVFGGGNEAAVYGNTTVNIGNKEKVDFMVLDLDNNGQPKLDENGKSKTLSVPNVTVLGANITGNVYGGGKKADVGQYDVANDHVDVVGNTYVNIGAKYNTTTEKWESVAEGTSKVLIAGNVFGGGEGEAAESGTGAFKCAKAIVTGGTNIHIGNGTINGTVYGGGEVGRVEGNSEVAIGIGAGGTTPASAPTILGDVFGAGKGKKTHGYSALMRGNPTVTIEGDAKVRGSVYGGGEIASVGRYNVKKGDNDPVGAPDDVLVGMPYSLASSGSGYCTVNIRGNAEIGPEAEMKMTGTTSGKPDDTGHVIGGGKGVLPYDGYGVTDDDWVGDPWRVSIDDQKDIFNESNTTYTTNYEKEYFKYIETLALATETNVTISGNAFVKGSVYGGSLNGHVQHDTHVNIEGGQIGQGEGKNGRYTATDWASESLAECPHWEYDKDSGAPYDPLATTTGSYAYTNYGFVPQTDRKADSKGGLPVAKDGHTYYGNVFGGGSGVIPYAPGLWHRGAGSVGGDTYVNITGGHILTSVYGGNEHTDVGTYEKDASGQPTTTPATTNARGKCTINMTGGTVGVPRTDAEKIAHPVVGNVFGAGKGDQRIFFNTWTNVINTEVNISGDARVYGSVFGGGEDGHVISDAETNIGNVTTKTGKDASGKEITASETEKGLIIGTTGTSYLDGNVFGGGRGFSGEAQTAGTVGGNVRLNINAGSVYGSVYGGGRLASVGTMFEFPTLTNGNPNPAYGNFKKDGGGNTYGHVTVNISGGTIGKTFTPDAEGNLPAGAQYSGNVFGGSMGRLELLNGTRSDIWPKMAQVKETNVNIYGTAVVCRSVYGGGELGTVRDDAYVTIGGYKTDDANTNGEVPVTTSAGTDSKPTTVRRDVYGGGYGSKNMTHTLLSVYELTSADADPSNPDNYDSEPHTYAYTPMQFAGCVGKNTYVNVAGGYIRKSVYGGGEMASVGVIDYRAKEVDAVTSADVVVKEATATNKAVVYSNMVKHEDVTKEFALSWPYKFNYVPGYNGATHVKISGGRLGIKDGEIEDGFADNGDVYGAGKGMAGDYKDYLFCANVGSTDVKIAYGSTPTAYSGTGDLIAGAVYGGGEDGHVMGDTKLTISGGLIYHSVYGGGSGKGKFSRKLLLSGKTYGSNNDADYVTRDAYSITAGKVFGNTEVNMSGGYVVRNIYGGGNMGSVGIGNYAGGSDDYSTAGYGEKVTGLWSNTDFLNSGKCIVKISGGTIGYIDTSKPSNSMYPYNSPASLPYGNVFGGCRGEAVPNITDSPRYYYCPEFFVGYANETEVTIEGDNTKILGSVYGGGMDGHVRRDAFVIIKGGEIGKPFDDTNKGILGTNPDDIQWLARGNVYGAGSGIGKYGDEFCTSAGSVTRFTTVDIQGGTIHRNVYGGGSLASIGAPKIPADRTDNPTKAQTLNTVTISGGQIGGDYSYNAGNHVYGGHVFGGSRGDASLDATKFSTSMFTSITINANATPANSPVIEGSVFGGGEVGIVKGSVDVTMNGGTVNDDVYGGGALANTNTETSSELPYATTVNLYGGLVKGDAYGGGLGQLAVAAVNYTQAEADAYNTANNLSEDDAGYVTTSTVKTSAVSAVPALVYGNVAVNLGNAERTTATGFEVNKFTEGAHDGIVKSGRVFGCNNLNGSPQGTVTVTVNKTVEGNTPKTASGDLKSSDATKHSYHVAAVYGGGNLAGKTVGGSTYVVINGCDVSIRDVYGGGNAAEVPATDVLVNGAYEIGEVFGGGNGKDDYTLDGGTTWTTNPGANVNGDAKTLLLGGLIHEAYGGSNEKGTITGNVNINTAAGRPDYCADCPLDVEKIVGAGKNADINGDLIMVLGCKPETKTPLVFGGADNANVNGNVELTITSGTFGQVFGGNNLGGVIRGHIILNIEETGCNPIKIDELYLGGNQAAYSRYGYYNAGTATEPDLQPRTAEMEAVASTDPNYIAPVGNPTVDATHPFPYDQPVLNVVSCTSIGKVFGGGLGEGAVMHADPTVNINMIPGVFANDETKGVPKVMSDMGLSAADNPKKLGIIGDVYGGGNAADVVGDPTVNIGTGSTVQLHRSYTTAAGYDMSDPIPVDGAYINGNVFGGGMGKADEFTCAKAMVGVVDDGVIVEGTDPNATYTLKEGGTSVVIAKGTVNGSVYGGGEVGRVERNTKVTIGVAGDETSEPIIKGDVFGAGKGFETHGYSALVRGNAEVTIQGKAQVRKNIHGGGEKASVGRYYVATSQADADTYHVAIGMPCYLKAGGKCIINIKDDAVIGTEGNANTGHIYGAGQGITPAYTYAAASTYEVRMNNSKRMVYYVAYDSETKKGHNPDDEKKTWDYYVDDEGHQDTRYVWEYFTNKDAYLQYVETLARASETDVTTDGNATVKGSIYGGSESGFVYHGTLVKIQNGTIDGDVFGGGKGLASFVEAGRVKRNTDVRINGGAIKGNVYGGGSLGDVGTITKNDDYNYTWTKIDGKTANTAENNKITDENTNTGICNVTISGGTIGTGVEMSDDGTYANGNVYGAGKGLNDTWWCEKAMVFATNVNIINGTVRGTVYGGGEVGRVEDDAKVTIGVANQTGETNAPVITGNVFGAGAGIKTHGYSALVRGNADVTVQGIAQIGGGVYGGGEIASVGRFTLYKGLPTKPETGGACTVTIQDKAKIGSDGTGHDVFGACKGVTPTYDPENYKESYSVQLYENRPKEESGDEKPVGEYWDYYETYPEGYSGQKFIKRYYKTETEYLAFLKTLALTSHPNVTIAEDASIYGSVYGGGQRGVTLGSVDVNILGGTISQDVYGGGALADTNLGNWDEHNGKWADSDEKSAYYQTKVNLHKGVIGGNVYGGGLGQKPVGTEGQTGYVPGVEAKVYGNTIVELNSKEEVVDGVKTYPDDCVVKGNIFGCNNLNGSPKGTTTVHIYKTQDWEGHEKTAAASLTDSDDSHHTYNVAAVYGGGNLAAYEPIDLENATTNVIIDGCGLTSIRQVYAGGNAASVPASRVTVNGTYEIEEVFGGGNGKDAIGKDADGNDIPNPGANVGFYDYSAVEATFDTKEKRQQKEFTNQYVYGSGKAEVNIFGGTIHRVFGGSNTKGNVRQSAITLLEDAEACKFCVDEAYGGGKSAPMDAEAKLLMACIPGLKEVYGGAQAADVYDDVTVTVTNGTFDRVFGGNNLSGTIRGSITVNIEETGCKPVIIGELYGGGNQAGYSVYGYDVDSDGKLILKESGDTHWNHPQVNVKSFTSIGTIYGGGYGAGAVMVGNPTVNINVVHGDKRDYTDNSTYQDANGNPVKYYETDGDDKGFKELTLIVDGHAVTLPNHKQGAIGAIGNVFGGGNAAKVIGNTNVNVGTEAVVNFVSKDDADHKNVPVVGADIRGNVYGGGNNAEVTGNTNVQIGKKKE